MKEMSVSFVLDSDEGKDFITVYETALTTFLPKNMEITEINYEKYWIPGKTRITFKGELK